VLKINIQIIKFLPGQDRRHED